VLGVTVHGMNVGKWLQKQRQHAVWQRLMDGQRERLEQLGITPLAPALEPEVPATLSTVPVSAFEKGVTALGRSHGPPGPLTVPRAQVERWIRNGGQARGVPEQQQEQARKAERRQARCPGRPWTRLGGLTLPTVLGATIPAAQAWVSRTRVISSRMFHPSSAAAPGVFSPGSGVSDPGAVAGCPTQA
jgi:hypothetical protein